MSSLFPTGDELFKNDTVWAGHGSDWIPGFVASGGETSPDATVDPQLARSISIETMLLALALVGVIFYAYQKLAGR